MCKLKSGLGKIALCILIKHSGLKERFFHSKLPEGLMFSKVNLSGIANGPLNLAETKFYEVGLPPPYVL